MRFRNDLERWEETIPPELRRDPLWRSAMYRFAVFAGDAAEHDLARLDADRRTRTVGDQLMRAVGSIGANIAEGYGRFTGKERARFYGYALGSVREAIHWYVRGRRALDPAVLSDRLECLGRIVRMLTAVIPRERARRDTGRRGPAEREDGGDPSSADGSG